MALVAGAPGIEFGRSNYWDYRGFLFLAGITIFPRITLLLSSVPTGGLFWWLGWAFAPRLLVAVLATFAYWQQNPVLVVIAWVVAWGGETSEKSFFIGSPRIRVYRAGGRVPPLSAGGESQGQGFESAKWVDADVKDT